MTGAWRFSTGADCVRHWRWYPHVGPAEIMRTIAPACIRVGVLLLPLALPGAVAAIGPAYPGAAAFERPALTGPAYETGALFVPGVYGMPSRVDGVHPLTSRIETGDTGSSVAVGESPTPYVTSHTPGMTEIQPASDVPEPSSLLLVAGFGVAALLIRVSE